MTKKKTARGKCGTKCEAKCGTKRGAKCGAKLRVGRAPRKRVGTVAKLPKAVRSRINVMLSDGLTYAGVIERLGKRGQGLSVRHLSSWWRGGYQDWIEENRRLEHLQSIREFCMRLVKENEGSEIQEAALKLAAGHIFELLAEFDVETLKKTFEGSPEDYARIVRALFQISGGGLKHDEFRAKVAECKARLKKELRRARNDDTLTFETLRRIEEQVGLL